MNDLPGPERTNPGATRPIRLVGGRVPWPLAILLLAFLYFLTARLGLLLASLHGNVSPVWPATGLALGALLLGGHRLWPAVLLGAFAANAATPIPIPAAGGICVGNTLEAVIGTMLIHWCWKRGGRLGALATPVGIVLAAALGSAASASIGVASLGLSGALSREAASTLWRTWWIGDALGALILVPLLLAIRESSGISWKFRMMGKAAGLAAVAIGICVLILFTSDGATWLFLIFPLLLLAAGWFGATGAQLAALTISAVCVCAARWGHGPFVTGLLNRDLLLLQVFLASVAIVAMVLPAFGAGKDLFLPGTVLLVGWALSGWMFSSLYRERRESDKVRFTTLATDAERAIRQRMTTYEDALRGGVSLFAASQSVERHEWKAYTDSLRLGQRYPGVDGVGAIFSVHPSETDKFVQAARADGAPDFTIHPISGVPASPEGPSERKQFVITFIEPIESNRTALGLNVASENNRFGAAVAARDTGEPRITRRIALVQDKQKRAGLLLYVPMYRQGASLETVEQRRAASTGWIYAPFIAESFLQGVLGTHRGEIDLSLFQGDSTATEDFICRSGSERAEPRPFALVTHFEMCGQPFTVRWDYGPAFVPSSHAAPVLAGASSAIVALLLAGLVTSLQSLHRRANAIAVERTAELQCTNASLQEQIARRVQVEWELRTSDERTRAALDATSDGLWDWNLVTGYVYFSPRLLEVLGYSADETEPHVRSWEKWLHPEDRAATMADLQAHLDGKSNLYQNEHRLRTKSGDWLWNLDRGRVVQRDVDGRPVRMIGTHTDITRRKEADKTLQRLAAVVEATTDFVGSADAQGRLLHLNRAGRRMMGLSEDEDVSNRRIQEFHPEAVASVILNAGLPTAAREGIWSGETILRTLQGREIAGSQVIMAHKSRSGEIEYYSTIIRDMTEERLAATELSRAKEAAELASRAKSDFLATMSHEIRTPMNGVLGFAELLRESDLSGKQRDWIETIHGSGQTLLALINDILDFSKIEAGKLALETIPFEPATSAQEVVEVLTSRSAEKKLRLDARFDPALPPCLVGDPARFKQVLFNLIGNAIKFTSQGHVSLELTWQPDSDARGTVRVSVSDTGIGIPPEKQRMLFQRFTQADSSTTRRFGGTGLGLAICKRLIELQGGAIGVASEPGRGSTFWFTLPLAVDSALQEGEPAAGTSGNLVPLNADSGAPSLRVLLAEDTAVNQKLATSLLAKRGCIVDVANNGLEAVAMATQNQYDLIFMDCLMPEKDGYEAAREIRSLESDRGAMPIGSSQRRVPIIAMTANALQTDRDLCLASGMDDYLSKPYYAADLDRILARWANGKKQAAA